MANLLSTAITGTLTTTSGSTVAPARFTNTAVGLDFLLGTDGVQSQYTNIVFYSNSGNAQIWKAGSGYSSLGGASSLNIYNSNGAIAFHPNSVNNAMFIATSGNVGIGTTSPSEKLDVNGNIKTSGLIYVSSTSSTALTPSANDWIDIAEMTYGEHHGKIAFEWNSLTAPSAAHHGWFEIEVGTYYSSAFNYGQDTYIEVTKALAHNDFWLSAVRVVDYGSTVRVQVQVARAVIAGTFRSFVLHRNQGAVSVLTPAINNNAYTVLASANVGEVDGDYVQKAIGNRARFTKSVAFDDKVGIGTTSPSTALDVVGTINAYRYQAISSSASLVGYGVGTGLGMFNAGTDTLGFATASTERMRINSAGQLLINATSSAYGPPLNYGYNLGVRGVAGQAFISIARSTQTLDSEGLAIGLDTNEGAIYLRDNLPLSIYTNNRFAMRVAANGNVGIGTTAPSTRFQVNKGSSGNVASFTTETNTAGAYAGITLNSTTQGADDWYGSEIRNINVNGNPNFLNPRLAFFVQNTNTYLPANRGEKMTINGDGNVGIGTTSPVGRLHLTGDYNGAQNTLNLENNWPNTYPTSLINFWAYYNTSNPQAVIEAGQDVSATNAGVISFKTMTSGAAPSTKMIIKPDGNVGIGTTSPSVPLTVIADSGGNAVRLLGRSGDSYAFTTFRNNADTVTNGEIGISNAQNMLFYTGTSERMRITSGGNVGIGTTAPTHKLDISSDTSRIVSNSSSYTAWFIANTGTGNAGVYCDAINGDFSGADYGFIGQNNSGYMQYDIAAASPAPYHVFSGGNVGIGTTSPVAKLHVSSSTNPAQGAVMADSKLVISGADGNMDLLSTDDNSTVSNNIGFGRYNSSTGALIHKFGITSWANTGSQGSNTGRRIAFNYGTSTNVWDNTELMSITSGGNVGIGTTAPADKLDVSGNARATRYSNFGFLGTGQNNARNHFTQLGAGSDSPATGWIAAAFGDALADRIVIGQWTNGTQQAIFGAHTANLNDWADTNYVSKNHKFYVNGTWAADAAMTLNSVGNLGIGTDSPAAYYSSKLVVYAGAENGITIANSGTTGSQYLMFADGTTGNQKYQGFLEYAHTGDYMAFATSGTEKMRIASSGNVGIGTTSPDAKLDISEGYIRLRETSIYANGWSVYNGSGYLSSRITTNSHSRSWGWEFTDNYPDSSTANVYFRVGYNGAASYLTSGNFGIGTSAPGYKLDVFGASNTDAFVRVIGGAGATKGGYVFGNNDGTKDYGKIFFDNSNNNIYFFQYYGAGDIIFGANSTERMRMTNAGNLGIGTTGPAEKLDVSGNARTSGFVLVNNHSNNALGYRISNTSGSSVSAMFVNSANALVIGSGAFDQVQLNKKTLISGAALGVNVAASATAGRIDASNDIVAYSSSDERLKHNITPIENALDKVKSLNGVEFDWKPEYQHAHGYEGHDTGIIAQQVQDVMPSAVRTNDTGFLAVRYEKLIGLLIEGMKEQQAQIDELKTQLNGFTK